MKRVEVKPELIRWAVERSRLSPDTFARALPKFKQWESGEAQPTLHQLEKLARKTWTPIGYFFLSEPPDESLPIPDFRTVTDTLIERPSPNLIDTLYMMQRRQSWMREYLVEMGHEPLAFVGSARKTDDVLGVAGKIRHTLGMDEGWASQIRTWTDALSALREAAEKVGVLMVINGVVGNNTRRKLDPEEFRGFVLSDYYAPLVFINGADARSAQMFTFAHELSHLWLDKGGLFNLPDLQPSNDRIEQFCNKVTAEFLVPARELVQFWPRVERDAEPFQAMARQFKVSPIVAARRALDLGLINLTGFRVFFHDYQSNERRKAARRKSGGDFYNNQNVRVGKRFARAVIHAAKEGRLSYRDAYSLTGLHGTTFDKYAKVLGERV